MSLNNAISFRLTEPLLQVIILIGNHLANEKKGVLNYIFNICMRDRLSQTNIGFNILLDVMPKLVTTEKGKADGK